MSLGVLLLLALLGVGMNGVGPIPAANRERYSDNGIKIEWVTGKKEEGTVKENKDKTS